ncbi:MAG: ABC transporter ATP-binding protein [Chloroflexi bacterium]|jgi:lipopolysaccharide transport system ATP-binding protein|nr:ABC transporter ATP-binding protein [Chloroflexota bacterium]
MSDLAIDVHNISKKYHIGSYKQSDKLSEQVVNTVLTPLRRAKKVLRGNAGGAAELDETIWALKDVSFQVRHGEVVGLIGRNGAGKSTILKILSRITDPTGGYADLFGRVGSLLEVGTGFHPELTGRENIYLNGAILGMHRHEIERKFDEIVAFAEIDQFIDTPVKHYSSGMYVRLAFSVAAHLEPEILLVDEVLAVGDVAFQKKCLGKMNDVSRQGRTVLFVSHNMGLLQSLCERGIMLDQGRVVADGPINQVAARYLQTLEENGKRSLAERRDRDGKGQIRLTAVDIVHAGSPQLPTLRSGDPARFIFHLSGYMRGMSCVFVIHDDMGTPLVVLKSDEPGPEDRDDEQLGAKFICEIDELLLRPGRYRINVLIRDGGFERQDFVEGAAFFDVQPGHLRGRPVSQPERNRSSVVFPHRWTRPA